MKLLLFCEAPADFGTASALVDRVVHAEGPVWVADLMQAHPESIREWVNDGDGKDFFDIHKLNAYRRRFPRAMMSRARAAARPKRRLPG